MVALGFGSITPWRIPPALFGGGLLGISIEKNAAVKGSSYARKVSVRLNCTIR